MAPGLLLWARRLTRQERRLLSAAWLTLAVAPLALALVPFRRLRGWAEGGTTSRRRADTATPERVAALVEAAARHHLYPMRCLPQALCLRWLLGRLGIAAELRIGVERRRGDLRAHAWVERDGRPVGEDFRVADRFAPLRPVS